MLGGDVTVCGVFGGEPIEIRKGRDELALRRWLESLSREQKAAIETLLGRRIQEDEAVSVRTFEPVAVSHQRRLEIANELRKYFAEVDAARKPVSEEEAEDIITEAMRSVRPGYRPHQ